MPGNNQEVFDTMSNLECNVFTCAYYADNQCCKPAIHVSGHQAKTSRDTCCASYMERNRAAVNSAVQYEHPNQSSEISCDACNCEYNAEGQCKANCVCVSCCCNDPKTESETECSTFCCAK